MKVVDLTHPIDADMPVYPGTPHPHTQRLANFRKDGFREQQLTISSHAGTHMDAPRHMLRSGRSLDQFPVAHFLGQALCIDVAPENGDIEWSWLQPYQEDLRQAAYVLLRTGWGAFWGSPQYGVGYPVLSAAAAEGLVAAGLKGVGVDAFSVDAIQGDYPVHRILLENNVLIIENLANLDRLPAGCFGRICALPLHVRNADGAPARVIAILPSPAKDLFP